MNIARCIECKAAIGARRDRYEVGRALFCSLQCVAMTFIRNAKEALR